MEGKTKNEHRHRRAMFSGEFVHRFMVPNWFEEPTRAGDSFLDTIA